MKTIFRLMNVGLILAAVIALGAVAGVAQDTCNADEVTAAQDKFDAEYKKGLKDRAARKEAIRLGKEFIEKYGANCEIAKVRVDWLKVNIPVKEKELSDALRGDEENAIVARFDKALQAKNWDEVYAAGKEIMARYPDKYRPAEIVLGTVGGEEAFKANFKYNDDAMKYAKQSIADLEAGKAFTLGTQTRYGLSLKGVYNFEYANKEDALGWLNMYIGYITQVAQKNKGGALPYLYKSTLGNTESSKQPTAYELIGGYYFDELNKIIEQIQIKSKDQKDTDTPEVAQKKVDELKALVAMSNGTAERAMDAFSRAASYAKEPAYKAKLRKNVEDAYKVRFGNTTGVDAWITNAVKTPFINPATPIQPISDPEPVTTTSSTTTTTTPPATTTTNGKPATTAPATKPATTPATKPATTPATKPAPTKPQATIKKPVKKRGAM